MRDLDIAGGAEPFNLNGNAAMKDAYTSSELASILNISRQAVDKRAADQVWPSRPRPGRGGGSVYLLSGLPLDVRKRIEAHAVAASPEFLPTEACEEPRIRALMQRFEAEPEWNRNLARARHTVLMSAIVFAAGSGLGKVEGFKSFAARYNAGEFRLQDPELPAIPEISNGTLLRWDTVYRREGMAGLLSGHGAARRGDRTAITPDLRVFLSGQLAERPHLRPARLYEMAQRTHPEATPSERTVSRFVQDWKAGHPELFSLLDDPRKWKSSYTPSFGSKSEDVPHFGHTWEMDSTRADVMTADGKRCCIIGLIDVYSRRARLLCAETSHSVAIAACMRLGLMAFGRPDRVRWDNGKDYQSNHLLAVTSALQIERIPTRPYHGEDKPFIERFLGTYTHGLHELLEGYTGHSVAERQALREKATWASKIMNPKAKLVDVPMTMHELQELTSRWLAAYESTAHKGLNGRTPLDMSRASRRQPKAIRDERTIDLLLAPVAERVVGKKGLALDGAVYFSEELAGHIGVPVSVRRDLEDAGTVYVFRREGMKFLCTAWDSALKGLDLAEYIRVKKAKERDIKAQARALKTLSRTMESPAAILLPAGQIVEPAPREKVLAFQAEADGPAIREAKRAFAEPRKAVGMAQAMGLEPKAAKAEEPKVIRLPEPRPEPKPEPEVERPYFTQAIDAWDWLCGQEKTRRLTPVERVWKDSLMANFGGEINTILDLRAEVEAERAFKERF